MGDTCSACTSATAADEIKIQVEEFKDKANNEIQVESA